MSQLLLGLVLSTLIGALAHSRGALSPSGTAGAVFVGTLIFGFGGLVWGLVLITFFVSSSVLSHYQESAKAELADKFAKGNRRDLVQTLANGGTGATLAVAYAIWGRPAILAAFIGVMATVNADTWATELGVLSRSPPRLISNGRVVKVGTSGGVSSAGLIASAAGALLIGLVAALLTFAERMVRGEEDPLRYAWIVAAALLAGMVGSLVDSLLGASVQAIFFCPMCAKETEKSLHSCGTRTRLARGQRWLNNDVVNLASSWAGGLLAGVVYWLW